MSISSSVKTYEHQKGEILEMLTKIIAYVKQHGDISFHIGTMIQCLLNQCVFKTMEITFRTDGGNHPVLDLCTRLHEDMSERRKHFSQGQISVIHRYLTGLIMPRLQKDSIPIKKGYQHLEVELNYVTARISQAVMSEMSIRDIPPFDEMTGIYTFPMDFQIVKWSDLSALEKASMERLGLKENFGPVESENIKRNVSSIVTDRIARIQEREFEQKYDISGLFSSEEDQEQLPMLLGTLKGTYKEEKKELRYAPGSSPAEMRKRFESEGPLFSDDDDDDDDEWAGDEFLEVQAHSSSQHISSDEVVRDPFSSKEGQAVMNKFRNSKQFDKRFDSDPGLGASLKLGLLNELMRSILRKK